MEKLPPAIAFRRIIPFKNHNYLPMVEMKVVLKASSENLNSKHVFPTPESPINSNLNNKS